jgi:hypothetical protein
MADAEPSKRLSRDECLAKAQECRDMARSNQNATHRVMLEQMAEAWKRMASPDPDR